MSEYKLSLAQRILKGDRLTEHEIEYLIFGYYMGDGEKPIRGNITEVDRVNRDTNRWTITILSFFMIDNDPDKMYMIEWQEGATEYQEDIFDEQPVKVDVVEDLVKCHRKRYILTDAAGKELTVYEDMKVIENE